MKQKNQWGVIGLLIAIASLIAAIYYGTYQTRIANDALEAAIAQLGVAREQLKNDQKRPDLEYAYALRLSKIDQQEVLKHADALSEKYYDKISNTKRLSPNMTYSQIIDTILPITDTLPIRPISVTMLINNKGDAVATRVRLTISMDRPIDCCNFGPSAKVIERAMSDKKLTIEIDRIIAGDSVSLDFQSHVAADNTQLGQLILTNQRRPDANTFVLSDDFESKHLPYFHYIAAGDPNVSISDIKADQGAAKEIPYPSSATGSQSVIMQNIAFVPNTLTIPRGTTVVWTNLDPGVHTVTSGTPGNPDGIFDSGQKQTGQSFSFEFDNAGQYRYYCQINGNQMTGLITVQ